MRITVVVVLVLVTIRSKVPRVLLIGAACTAGSLIAISRVFLGVHYLSDVVAGLLLGMSLTLLTWLGLLAGRRHIRQEVDDSDRLGRQPNENARGAGSGPVHGQFRRRQR